MKYCPTCKINLADNTRICYQCGRRASVFGPYDHSFMGDYYNYSDDKYDDEEKDERNLETDYALSTRNAEHT